MTLVTAAGTTGAPLVDSHCHLDFADFGPERDAVLARARTAGVRWFITIGSGRGTESAPEAVALAGAHTDVLATVGIHPHDAAAVTDATVGPIAALAREPRVVGVGEVGLDYHYEHSPREAQKEVFRRFITLAREVGKPLVIHTRNAPADTLASLREEGARDVGGVIHCFSEDTAFARAALDLDFDISFSGIVTFKKADDLRAAARTVPLDRMLLETDAPYLAPPPHRGKRNEPAFLAVTAAHLAGTLGIPVDELRARTSANAVRRFNLARFEPSS
jgi:TatD DNase family protein